MEMAIFVPTESRKRTEVLMIIGDLCGFYRACLILGFPEDLVACSETTNG
jgi:hypothetical protein